MADGGPLTRVRALTSAPSHGCAGSAPSRGRPPPEAAHWSRFHGRNSPLTVVFAGCCKRSPASYPDRVIAGLADGACGLVADACGGPGHRGHGPGCCVTTEMPGARLGPPPATAWKRGPPAPLANPRPYPGG